MSNSCKIPDVKPIVIKRFGVSGLVPTIPTTTDCNLWSKTDLKDGELAINIRDKKLYIRADEQILEITNQSSGGGSGSVTSVGLSMPTAFNVASSPITSSGTITVTGAGTTSQYIRGDGSLATFPSIPSVTPAALTRTNDTNVTLTLGGTPGTALLQATSLTLGWTGQLSISRGGTGLSSLGTANQLLRVNSGATALEYFTPTFLTAAITSLNGLTGASQTFTNDTNVVITSFGTAHSLGWTGQLAVSRGGTGASAFTANNVLLGNGTSAFQVVAPGTSGNVLTSNGTTWVSQAPSGGGISGLTANRFVYATGATTVATDNDAYFDGTQIAFGTTSPITGTRTTILGSGTSTSTTTFGLQVHNVTGNNNALVVRDDGFVGFGGLPFSTLRYRFSVGTNLNVYFANIGGQTSLGAVDDVTTGIQFNINGNPLVWQVATVEYLRLTSTNLRVQNTIFDVNQSIGTGQAVSLLNLNNTNNQVATSILNFTIAGGNLAQLRAEATAGDDNVQIRVTNSAGTLIEPIRFQGSGNVLIGTTTDNPRALLNLTSTSKGLLLPRMDTTQRDAVSWVAGDAGMVIFNTSTNEFQGWDGTTWKNFH